MAERRLDVVSRGIAGFGLPDMPEAEETDVPDQLWRPLLSRVRRERITGLAVECGSAGWLELLEPQASELLAAHRDAMAWCLSVERKLLGLSDAFDAELIPFAVLKGASVAHTVYADPSLRSFADLDLLVGSGNYERACRLLQELGHVRRQPEPRPGFDVRFGRASVHKHPDDKVEVDLHRTPGWGPFTQWIRAEELLDRAATFRVGGRRIARLDDTGMLLIAAMHACLGARSPKLVALRDVLQIAQEGHIDWDVLSRWAARWHLTAVLRYALATAAATFASAIPVEARRRFAPEAPERDARLLAAYTGERRDRGATVMATLGAMPNIRMKATYLAALALPDHEFLAARVGTGRFPLFRRWRVPFRWASGWVADVRGRVWG